MSNINWREPNVRRVLYASLLQHVGPFSSQPIIETEALGLIALGMTRLGFIQYSSTDALAMQYRWATYSVPITSPNAKSSFKLIFCNRVPAVQVGFMTMHDVGVLYEANEVANVDRVLLYTELAVEGRMSLNDAINCCMPQSFPAARAA